MKQYDYPKFEAPEITHSGILQLRQQEGELMEQIEAAILNEIPPDAEYCKKLDAELADVRIQAALMSGQKFCCWLNEREFYVFEAEASP